MDLAPAIWPQLVQTFIFFMTLGPNPNCSSWRFFAFSVTSFRPSPVCKQCSAFAASICLCCYLCSAGFTVIRHSFVRSAIDTLQNIHIVHSVDHPISALAAKIEVVLSLRFPGQLHRLFRRIRAYGLCGADMGSGQCTKKLIAPSTAIREHPEICCFSVHDSLSSPGVQSARRRKILIQTRACDKIK